MCSGDAWVSSEYPTAEGRREAWLAGFARARALIEPFIGAVSEVPPSAVISESLKAKPALAAGVSGLVSASAPAMLDIDECGSDSEEYLGDEADVVDVSEEVDGDDAEDVKDPLHPALGAAKAAAVRVVNAAFGASSVLDTSTEDVARSDYDHIRIEDLFDDNERAKIHVDLSDIAASASGADLSALIAECPVVGMALQARSNLSELEGFDSAPSVGPLAGEMSSDHDGSAATCVGDGCGDASKPSFKPVIQVPRLGGGFDSMYVATVVALLSAEPTASADRLLRIRNAAKQEYKCLSVQPLQDHELAVNMDCGVVFDDGDDEGAKQVAYGRVIRIGRITKGGSVRDIAMPVSLQDRDESVSVWVSWFEKHSDGNPSHFCPGERWIYPGAFAILVTCYVTGSLFVRNLI